MYTNHYRVICIYTGRLLALVDAKTERGAARKAGISMSKCVVVLA